MKNLKAIVPVVVFVLGLCGVAFGYGVAVGVYQIFPYHIISDAQTALYALIKVEEEHKWFVGNIRTDVAARLGDRKVATYKPGEAFNGYTFYVGLDGGYTGAVLIDMDGKPLHRWHKRFSEVWPHPTHVEHRGSDDAIDWHGAHLYSNGDVLFNFTGGNFPYGSGLVKIDRDSNVIWSLARNTHHAVDVLPDGTIYALAHNYRHQHPKGLSKIIEAYHEDVILIVSPDGKVRDEISILDAIRESDYRGLLSLNYRDSEDIATKHETLGDPFHANTVEVLRPEMADAFPFFEAGDILISLRNINMIGIIRPSMRKLVWAMVGPFVRQHDPDFTAKGTIMVYDNRGHVGPGGRSRIIEIDPASQAIIWSYTGTADIPFYSWSRGKLQVLPNGNVLTIEPSNGRIFEINHAGELVWEYVNRLSGSAGEDVTNKVGSITQAERYAPGALAFVK